MGVVDQDHSTASRQLIRQLDATSKIAIETYDSLEQAQRDLSWRKLFAVIIMPVDLEKKILSGQNIVVPVYGDATNRLANGQIQQDVVAAYQQLLTEYNNGSAAQRFQRTAGADTRGRRYWGKRWTCLTPASASRRSSFPACW